MASAAPKLSWDLFSDEENEVDQRQQTATKIKRLMTPQAAAPAMPSCEIPDEWDKVDEERLVESLPVKVPQAKPPTGKPAGMLQESPISDTGREVIASVAEEKEPVKVTPAIEKRHWGKVKYFKGSYGWVTSDTVRTGRTVNPQGYRSTEISDAIHLHKSDCHFIAHPRCRGTDVNFCLVTDAQGNWNCADVHSMETYMNSKQAVNSQDSKPQAATSSQDQGIPRAKAKEAKLSHDASNDDEAMQKWLTTRFSSPQKATQPARKSFQKFAEDTRESHQKTVQDLSFRNVELHQQETGSCGSSTAAGLTSRSASVTDVTSEFDVKASMLRTASESADRPRHIHSSDAAAIALVSRHVVVEEREAEEVAPDQPPVVETWEDLLEEPTAEIEEPKAEEAAADQPYVETCTDLIEEPTDEQPTEEWVAPEAPVVGWPFVFNADAPEFVPSGARTERRRRIYKVTNRRIVSVDAKEDAGEETVQSSSLPSLEGDRVAPVTQGERLAQFCLAMGPQFPFEFVAHHLGTDFDAVVEKASDVRSLDSLVQAGMKPLLRNKFCRALRQEKERQATQRQSRKHDLADFLARMGPEFDHAFLARKLGSDNVDEIIMQFTDVKDLDFLVVAGMKPLLKNKLYRQLTLERKSRATKC